MTLSTPMRRREAEGWGGAGHQPHRTLCDPTKRLPVVVDPDRGIGVAGFGEEVEQISFREGLISLRLL